MAIVIGNDWQEFFNYESKQEYYCKLREKLTQEYLHGKIFPDKNNIFNAFCLCSYSDTKVCIIGQDPYHDDGQAHGLAFSVQDGIRKPPSLLNIFKELKDDLGIEIAESGCLDRWAKQGVLLMNAVLSVRAHQAGSHRKLGWEELTNNVIIHLNKKTSPVVFILWGNYAKQKSVLITNPIHHIISSPHPSPLSASRGFFGSKPFSRTNEILDKNNITPIDW